MVHVHLGFACSTPDSAKLFTSVIAKSQCQTFLDTLSGNFFSFLMDSSVDAGNKEDKLIVLVYCAKYDSTREVTPKTRYWSVCNPERADAAGLLACLEDSLKNFGVEDVLDKDSVLEVEDKPVLVLMEPLSMSQSRMD